MWLDNGYEFTSHYISYVYLTDLEARVLSMTHAVGFIFNVSTLGDDPVIDRSVTTAVMCILHLTCLAPLWYAMILVIHTGTLYC